MRELAIKVQRVSGFKMNAGGSIPPLSAICQEVPVMKLELLGLFITVLKLPI
jgi:hypothetical protein